MISTRLSGVVRKFSTSIVRRSLPGGTPGENLPFNICNRNTVTLWFTLFFGSSNAIPYLILRYHLKKQNST